MPSRLRSRAARAKAAPKGLANRWIGGVAATGARRLSLTNTDRRRSATLLQMPRGLMCKLRQRGQGYGGPGPAGARGIDPTLQPPPAVAARLRGKKAIWRLRWRKAGYD